MENNLEILVEKMPRHGMSKKCQELLPSIARHYFNKTEREELRLRFGKKNRGYVDVIYGRLEQIKVNSSRKICGVLAVHPKDLEDDVTFADSIIRYSMHFKNLKKEIFKVFNSFNKDIKNSLLKRYKRGIKNTKDRYALETLANAPEIYVFIMDEILNRN